MISSTPPARTRRARRFARIGARTLFLLAVCPVGLGAQTATATIGAPTGFARDRIARIDPKTGRVKAWIDLTGLSQTAGGFGPDAVLNGIAYDPRGDRLFVTGKNWSKLFQIALRRGADGAPCPAFGAKPG